MAYNKEGKANYQREYFIKKPWAKTLRNIKRRCNDKSHYYYKKGIKCLIALEELKFLWDRDGASSMTTPSIDRLEGGDYTLDNCRYLELLDNQSREKWRETSNA